MAEPSRPRPPIAVVGLGDITRHDDALALRVLGRVRTLVGEIGVARARAHGDGGRPVSGAASTSVLTPPGTLIEWIEGGSDPERLDPVLGGRRRVVLVDAVRVGGKAGAVHHWHLRCDPRSKLTRVQHYNGRSSLGLQHLALWLEDELPEHGTDLIGIQAVDLTEGEGLSRPITRLLPSISAQVAGLLVRILEEEGW